jgi:hypothetical protein
MIGVSRSPFIFWSLVGAGGLLILSIFAIFSSNERPEVRVLGLIMTAILLPLFIGGMFEWAANPRLFLLETSLVLRRWGSDTELPFGEVTRIRLTRDRTGLSVTIFFRDHKEFWMKGEGQGAQLARRLSALSGMPIKGM